MRLTNLEKRIISFLKMAWKEKPQGYKTLHSHIGYTAHRRWAGKRLKSKFKVFDAFDSLKQKGLIVETHHNIFQLTDKGMKINVNEDFWKK